MSYTVSGCTSTPIVALIGLYRANEGNGGPTSVSDKICDDVLTMKKELIARLNLKQEKRYYAGLIVACLDAPTSLYSEMWHEIEAVENALINETSHSLRYSVEIEYQY